MPRIYAIGDIHGSLGKLKSLVALCERDAAGAPMRLVFLGDYIDRGPDSRGVLDYLIALQEQLSGAMTALMGNHEAMALAAAADSLRAGAWLHEGGGATLRSFGIASAFDFPRKHLAWLHALRMSYDDGQRLFVHAGVNPEKPLDGQEDDDLLWIREPFLSDARDYGRFIVHGHTPTMNGQPDLRINRLNLDTGAVFGNALTAAVFAEDQAKPMAFLQANE
jgi:serine/threonine protein phosphatase 1